MGAAPWAGLVARTRSWPLPKFRRDFYSTMKAGPDRLTWVGTTRYLGVGDSGRDPLHYCQVFLLRRKGWGATDRGLPVEGGPNDLQLTTWSPQGLQSSPGALPPENGVKQPFSSADPSLGKKIKVLGIE